MYWRLKYIRYATYETLPGGWDQFPEFGILWCRVLQQVGSTSPIRNCPRADVDAQFSTQALEAKLTVNATQQVDDTFLPEPRIIANFQYCMDKRFEGGTYHFGVLQPEGEFSANYNGYWAWRNLRGRMLESRLAGAEGQDSLRSISSISRDCKTVTTIVYFGAPLWRDKTRYDKANVDLEVTLPPGQWKLTRSRVTWNQRQESEAGTTSGHAKVQLALMPYEAAALTWTRK